MVRRGEGGGFGVIAAALLATACGGRGEAVRPAPVPTPSAVPTVAVLAPPAEPSVAPPVEPPVPTMVIAIHAGEEPCILEYDGGADERADVWFLRSVTRLATRAGGACAAGVLFDSAAEPDGGWLSGLYWVKPGHAVPAEDAAFAADYGPGLADLDFDGYLDGCTISDPMSETPQRCWIFDAPSRTFVHHAEIDGIPGLQRDADRKILTGYARSGNVYEGTEYGWLAGKLELVVRHTSWLGETPDGKSIPGLVYVEREERRGDKMVTVRAGVEKP